MEFFQTLLLVGIVGFLIKKAGPGISARQPKHQLILDSCALIDGRIVELVRTGFVSHTLVVPQFIIHELQLLADGHDATKRSRARFGLDVIRELQDSRLCTVLVDQQDFPSIVPTDDKLVALAKMHGAQLYTTDFNLNKVAEIQDVRVLNVNDLAQNLRPAALPGERKVLKVMQKGNNPKQGVGYLDDGTMVVVDNGATSLGKTIEVEISRIHQTLAGKMLFAEAPRTNNKAQKLKTSPTIAERMKRVMVVNRPKKVI